MVAAGLASSALAPDGCAEVLPARGEAAVLCGGVERDEEPRELCRLPSSLSS
jgi:hypothetical protein